MGAYNLVNYMQAEAHPTARASDFRRPPERLKECFDYFPRKCWSGVGNTKLHGVAAAHDTHVDATIGYAVLNRVTNQITQNLFDSIRVPVTAAGPLNRQVEHVARDPEHVDQRAAA